MIEEILLKINKLREVKKLSKDDFGPFIGVSRGTGYNYLDGKTKICVETLGRIAEKFQVPISYFFEDNSQTKLTTAPLSIIGNGSSIQLNENNNTSIVTKDIEVQKQRIEGLEKEIESLHRELKAKDEIIALLRELGKR